VNESETGLNDPDDYLRRQRYRKKLHAHAELVKLLLAKGFTAYMVWRYLNEEVGLKVSRNTVLRFARKVRAEKNAADHGYHPHVIQSTHTLPGATVSHTNASPCSALSTESKLFSESAHPQALDHLALSANDKQNQRVFWDTKLAQTTRIVPTRSSAALGSDILRPFDANDPAFIAEERRIRLSRGK
jgi:hypothetical protein